MIIVKIMAGTSTDGAECQEQLGIDQVFFSLQIVSKLSLCGIFAWVALGFLTV